MSSKTLITEKQLEKLEGLIGYGKASAEIIFVGLEEGGGGYSNLLTRINTENYTYLDCKRFHLDKLNINLFHNDISSRYVKFQPVWRFMSYLMLRLDGYSIEDINSNKQYELRNYQNNYLGSLASDGKALLTELYPIPCSGFGIWGINEENYIEIIPQYVSKDEYKRVIIPKRRKLFETIVTLNPHISYPYNAITNCL